jgi:hypothetical protein
MQDDLMIVAVGPVVALAFSTQLPARRPARRGDPLPAVLQ